MKAKALKIIIPFIWILGFGATLYSPIFFHRLFSTSNPFFAVDTKDIGPMVGAYSSLIAGAFTLISVVFTIRNQNNSNAESNRMTILPFLSFKFVKDQKIINKDEASLILLPPQPFPKEGIKPIATLQLEIKNIGVGVAVAPSLKKSIVRDETPTKYLAYESAFSLYINEIYHMEIDIFSYNDIGSEVDLTFGFFDVLGNYYTQNILFQIDCDYVFNMDWQKENLKITFLRVETPKLSNKSRDFNYYSKVEILKRRIKRTVYKLKNKKNP